MSPSSDPFNSANPSFFTFSVNTFSPGEPLFSPLLPGLLRQKKLVQVEDRLTVLGVEFVKYRPNVLHADESCDTMVLAL